MKDIQKERNAAKALARSKRNSPGGQKTRTARKSERKHKTANRKLRQSVAARAINEATPGLDVLSEQTVKQLRQLADQKGIKTTSKMKKQEIIDLLEQA